MTDRKLLFCAVGVTLILLGLWICYSLWRYGSSFRLQSRWMVVFALVSTAWRGPGWTRAALTAAVALAIELRQVVATAPGGVVGAMTLGSTFDGWDLIAYGVGIAAAWSIERRATTHRVGQGQVRR